MESLSAKNKLVKILKPNGKTLSNKNLKKEEMNTEEGVVIRVAGLFGHLWSPTLDRVFFGLSDIVGKVDMQKLVPGTAATFNVEKRSEQSEIEWKGKNVVLHDRRSILLVEGYGSMTRVQDSFGFIDSPLFDSPIFVPPFATSNNLPPDRACQIHELEAREVHFSAIPNPKSNYANLFCISVHESNHQCRNNDLPLKHWIMVEKPVQIRISDTVHPAETQAQVPIPFPETQLTPFEVVVCLLHQKNGYFWSPDHGKMLFTKNNGEMSPGQAVDVVKFTRPKTTSPTCRTGLKQMQENNVVVSEYSCLEYRSSLVVEGVGVFRWGRSSGVIFDVKEDESNQRPILVPLWALRNGNSLLSGKSLAQSPAKFEGRFVHYIAVQAHSLSHDTLKRVCVIALHEEAPMCSSPEQMSNKHWKGVAQSAPDLQLPHICHGLDGDSAVNQSGVGNETEGFLTYVRTNHGYLHHPEKGRVFFDKSSVVGLMEQAVPGTRCLVTIAPLVSPQKKCKSQWKALSVTLLGGKCPQVWEGRGTVYKVHRTFGMVHCLGSKQQLFLPGWAGVNCQQCKGWQVPDLAAGSIHFLAMNNPKTDHQSEPFIISAHPLNVSCDIPMAQQHGLHWANPNQKHKSSINS